MSHEELKPAFVDQIVGQTLEALSERPEFDDETLERLRELAASSGLTNSEKVVAALSDGERT